MEKDPNGLNAKDPGSKLDAGKIRYSLIPHAPLKWLATLYTNGAAKYSDWGWSQVENGEVRYFDALLRHLESYRSGEWLDSDTNVPHLIAVAWNAFAMVWFRENK